MRRTLSTAKSLLNATVVVLAGLALGYFTVDAAVTRGFSPLVQTNGPWSTWPDAASAEADPYTRAHFAAFGKLGLMKFEALDFRAETDSDGRPLSQACTYILSGSSLAGRWWNIAAYEPDRTLIPNKADRHSFNSENLLRAPDGTFRISLSSQPQQENWLPLGNSGNFRLVLTIMDPPANYRANPAAVALPRLERRSC